jgi:glycosyltransferase involved in cell wall biosynthesis
MRKPERTFISRTCLKTDVQSSISELNSETLDKPKKIGIVVPAFNEKENIGKVLEAIKGNGFSPSDIIVVDDGSSDDTYCVAQKANAFVVRHKRNRGAGAALKTGFTLALKKGFDIVVLLDADGQHDPAEIRKILLPILSGEADMTIGSRFLGSYQAIFFMRFLGITWLNLLIRLITNVRITDSTSGFRAITSTGLAMIDMRAKRHWAAEMIIEAWKRNLRIKEVPVNMKRRQSGTSFLSERSTFYAYPLRVTFAIIKCLLRG